MMLRPTDSIWFAAKPRESLYLRYLSDFDVNLEIAGEKIVGATKVLHELYGYFSPNPYALVK